MKQLVALGIAVVLVVVAVARLWPSRGSAPTLDAARATLGLGAPKPVVKGAAGTTGATGTTPKKADPDDPDAPTAETDDEPLPADWMNRPRRPTRFDIENAMSRVENAVLACHSLEEASGTITVKLEFNTSGACTSATVLPPFAGTKTGQCVARAASNAKLPPFAGVPTPTVQVTFPYYFAPNE